MKIKVGEEMVEVAYSSIQEGLRADPEYNAEVDRIVAGRTNAFETEYKVTSGAEMSQLKADHQAELEAAKAVSTGKGNEAFEGLKTQMQILTDNFNKSETDRMKLISDNKKGAVENELIKALSGVADPYDKKNITADAMCLLDTETGQFKLSTGAMGSVEDIVKEMQSVHANRFLSTQPNGSGIKDGAATPLPANATPAQKRAAEINSRIQGR